MDNVSKRIVIDCRYLGMSGIGRVLEEYLNNLPSKERIVFYGSKSKLEKLDIKENIIECDESPVSKKGIFVDKRVNEYDCFFTPNFIIPFGVKIPTYTLIHDLMFLDFKDSTNGFVDRKIKAFFYKRCAKRSKAIYTVSNFSKMRAIHHFPACERKINVVYNGVSNSIIDYGKNHPNPEKKDYLVFVGNIKKQKGLSVLLDAFKKQSKYELYIVGEMNNFRTSDDSIDVNIDDEHIHFTGRVGDEELFKIISEASFIIQPSFYEGFGIPPMEALCLGTTPIISDIDVFKEVYGNLPVVFFKCGDSNSLLKAINSTKLDYSRSFRFSDIEQFSFKKAISKIMADIEHDIYQLSK